jgi:hypothetical protein
LKPVLVADHAAEAGAGGREVVLQLGDSLLELRVLPWSLTRYNTRRRHSADGPGRLTAGTNA